METVLDEVCASCGNTRLPDGRFCLFCGDLLAEPSPGDIRRAQAVRAHLNSVSSIPDRVEYAGFWLRVWAGVIDVCLEVVGALLLTLAIRPFVPKVVAGEAFVLFLAVGSWLYCAFAESSSWRATVGKRVLGLQVVASEGDKISFGQATVRHLMKFLSLFCLTIGFLMSGWTKRRQALHDMPCDCLVIRTPGKSIPLLRR